MKNVDKALLFFILLISGCQTDKGEGMNDPRKLYGLRDATTTRILVEKAVEGANRILSQEGGYFLIPSWKPGDSTQENRGTKYITVYLLRPKSYFPTFDYEKSVIDSFATVLKNTRVDPALDNCADTDTCVHRMYGNSNIGKVVADILSKHATLEIAGTIPNRSFIALTDGDLQKFQLLFERNLEGETMLPGFENFITIILLHELGHLNKSFNFDSLHLSGEAKKTYSRYLNELNDDKREEARADAFASKVIKDAVFSSNGLTREEKEIAIYIPLQSLLAYRYYLFDKSEGGICRHYFDPTDKHPNFDLRYQAMSLILMPDSKIINVMNDYITKREIIASKPYASENPECTCLYY